MVDSEMKLSKKSQILSELGGNLGMMHQPGARAIVGMNFEVPATEILSPIIQTHFNCAELFFVRWPIEFMNAKLFLNRKRSDDHHAHKIWKEHLPRRHPTRP